MEKYDEIDRKNAKYFANKYRGLIHYVPPWDKWIIWDGKRWKIDETGEEIKRLAAMAFAERELLDKKGDDDK